MPAAGHRVLFFPSADAAPVWITARGNSMVPAWTDGALLCVAPAAAALLRIGDGIVYHNGEGLIAHRLFARYQDTEGWWWLRPKADAGCAPEPWLPETALVGRIAAVEASGRQQVWDRGSGRWRQRVAGCRQRLHVALHAAWAGMTRQRGQGPSAWPALESDPRLTWGRHIFLRERLSACLRLLAPLGIEPMLLKGQALVLTGVVDPAERPMADIDLLIAPEARAAALRGLQAAQYRVRGPTDAWRASLDDQIPLEDPAGAVFDIHWSIVNGGWRFRDVIRIDYAGLWARSERWDCDGQPVRVMSPPDQFLHLCLHLILSGAAGQVWWRDLRSFLEHHGGTLDRVAILALARQAHCRTVAWLALDTLWQRWRVPVPGPLTRALRPGPLRRALLRRLLPATLETATDESRWQRHARELLLMDRPVDWLRLLWRWSRPPRIWHVLKNSARHR